jgi:hypothetical protein
MSRALERVSAIFTRADEVLNKTPQASGNAKSAAAAAPKAKTVLEPTFTGSTLT